jgi:formylglycine-generating enzyme required for sulfatase activity
MKEAFFLILFVLGHSIFPSLSPAKELPKIAVWDLEAREVKGTYAKELTSFLVSEINKLGKYETYSQEQVRTLAGWTGERMKLGCTNTKCLTALGQMDVSKLVSGSVGKIGNRFTVSLSLFDTQNARAENSISDTCRTEDDLIELVQVAVRKLLGEAQIATPAAPAMPPAPMPPQPPAGLEDAVTGLEFVFVKGGCFEMGDSIGDGDNDEKPVHQVCVDDFYLGKYEVTQGQWEEVMGNNPSYFKNCGDNCPVEAVSWNDVQEFISRLNQKSGKRYRLPMEAEWEYAARSGRKGEKWPGVDNEGALEQYAWYAANSDVITHPVGEKSPSGLGLYDMIGNVREWCSDWYGENYYQGSPRKNPAGPGSGSEKVIRGGSCGGTSWNVRAAARTKNDPADRDGSTGFRLASPAP